MIHDSINPSFISDSTFFIGVSNNLFDGKGLTSSYIPSNYDYAGIHGNDISNLIKTNPNINSEYSKPPVFFILEGAFFEITNANESNWVFITSVFTAIISSFFIVLFYLLIRKYFEPFIAVSSTLVVFTSFFFLTEITHGMAHTLTYLFIVLAFFFLEKKIKHYFLFGLFISLGILTHELAVIPLFSYITFLIFKYEIKGSLIVLGTWFIILFPWMIRQFQIFGDFGIGVGIPFSNTISSFFIAESIESSPILGLENELISASAYLQQLFFNSHLPYNLPKTDLLVFFFIFVGFSFFLSTKLQKCFFISKIKQKIFLILTLSLILILFLGIFDILILNGITLIYETLNNQFYSEESTMDSDQEINRLTLVIQFLIIFIPIITLIYFLRKYFLKNNLFDKDLTRFHSIIPFIMIFSIFAMYIVTIRAGGVYFPPFYPALFLTLPLGILGLKKFIGFFIFDDTKLKKFLPYVVIGIILIISISFILDQSISWIITIHEFDWRTNENFPDFYNWFNENINNESVIMTTYPANTYLNTGNPTVPIPNEFYSNSFETKRYIEHYNVEYILLLNPIPTDIIRAKLSSFTPVVTCNQDCMILKYNPNQENYIELAAKEFLEVYNYDVLKIKKFLYDDFGWDPKPNEDGEIQLRLNFTDEDVNKLSISFIESTFDQINPIIQLRQEKNKQSLENAKIHEQSNQYYDALSIYDKLLETNKFDFKALEGKIRVYQNLDDKTQVNKIFDEIYLLYQEKINTKSPFDSPIETFQTKYLETIRSEIHYWQNESSDRKLLDAYEEFFELDKFSQEGWYGKAETLEKLGKLPEAIRDYNFLLRVVPSEQTDEIQNKITEIENRLKLEPKNNKQRTRIISK
ncbi:glycosyltransferase family 39 protein [Nitrosopumilus sp. b3]|uniref:glycosyltransferase family 39 protein n=1 Tax=Nitrosopumilus sp. b3 TaxID=2109909 RepID=UPI0015F4B491|nr:glycosyltransferase family 39 protein [Nitrosopumilus sp. b3]